jgi:hypothetical protein
MLSLAAAVITLAGCSGSKSVSAPSSAPSQARSLAGAASTGTVSTAPSATPAPNATESNPAGDISDTQAFVTYTAATNAFSVQVPEGWAQAASGQTVTFADKYDSITITSQKRAAAPTVASATSDELPAVRTAAHGFANPKVQAVQRAAGPVVLITYQADSAPNPVTGKVAVEAVERYEFYRAGTEVALTVAAPIKSDNVDQWRKVTDSFTWH